jgi:hypothetical protein
MLWLLHSERLEDSASILGAVSTTRFSQECVGTCPGAEKDKPGQIRAGQAERGECSGAEKICEQARSEVSDCCTASQSSTLAVLRKPIGCLADYRLRKWRCRNLPEHRRTSVEQRDVKQYERAGRG